MLETRRSTRTRFHSVDQPQPIASPEGRPHAWTVLILGLAFAFLVVDGFVDGFSTSHYHPLLGSIQLAGAALILFATAQYWVRILPLLLAIATLNAIASIFSGYAYNLRPNTISRFDASICAVLFGAGAALSPSFTPQSLSMVDRFAFLAYASCISWSVVDHRVFLPAQIAIGTICLFAAWVYDDLRSRYK